MSAAREQARVEARTAAAGNGNGEMVNRGASAWPGSLVKCVLTLSENMAPLSPPREPSDAHARTPSRSTALGPFVAVGQVTPLQPRLALLAQEVGARPALQSRLDGLEQPRRGWVIAAKLSSSRRLEFASLQRPLAADVAGPRRAVVPRTPGLDRGWHVGPLRSDGRLQFVDPLDDGRRQLTRRLHLLDSDPERQRFDLLPAVGVRPPHAPCCWGRRPARRSLDASPAPYRARRCRGRGPAPARCL
jgi:hypothetical protein